jgi:hypothetical protein
LADELVEADLSQQRQEEKETCQTSADPTAGGQAQDAAVRDGGEFGSSLGQVGERRARAVRCGEKGGGWPAAQRTRNRVTCWRKAA